MIGDARRDGLAAGRLSSVLVAGQPGRRARGVGVAIRPGCACGSTRQVRGHNQTRGRQSEPARPSDARQNGLSHDNPAERQAGVPAGSATSGPTMDSGRKRNPTALPTGASPLCPTLIGPGWPAAHRAAGSVCPHVTNPRNSREHRTKEAPPGWDSADVFRRALTAPRTSTAPRTDKEGRTWHSYVSARDAS